MVRAASRGARTGGADRAGRARRPAAAAVRRRGDAAVGDRRRRSRCRSRWSALQVIVRVHRRTGLSAIAIDLHELGFVATARVDLPADVFARLGAADRAARSAPGAGVAGGRGSTATMRGRGVLVVVQVALAVILLTVSSLAVRSIRAAFTASRSASTSDRLLIFGMEFNDAHVSGPRRRRAAAADATRDALAALPGVHRRYAVTALPVLGDQGRLRRLTIDGTRHRRPDALDAAGRDQRAPAPMRPATLGVSTARRRWWSRGHTDAAVISQTDGAALLRRRRLAAIGRHFSIAGMATSAPCIR